MATPNAFFNNCVDDFHQCLRDSEMLDTGVIFIPELMSFGQKAILAYLTDNSLIMEYGSNPALLYTVINTFTFHTGVAFALKWNEGLAELNDSYEDIIKRGPAFISEPFIKEEFDFDQKTLNNFNSYLNQLWLGEMEPYKALSDSKPYIFSALMASYQLGISLALSRLGYK